MTTKTKPFDAVKMQDRAGARIASELAGMTVEQQVAYWARRTRELRETAPSEQDAWDTVLEVGGMPADPEPRGDG